MSSQETSGAFRQTMLRLREEYRVLRTASNLFEKKPQEFLTQRVDGTLIESFWFENGDFLRLYGQPGTLSGEILALRRNLPPLQGHYEIVGDCIRKIELVPEQPEYPEDDEDITDLVQVLPEVAVDPDKHFVKQGKYRSEIENLLLCQGGSCPGQPISPHLVQLLGRSGDRGLVFPKLRTFHEFDHGSEEVCSWSNYKRWILHLIEALKCLHSLGIVHRDVHYMNFLFSEDGERLLLADLESRWGQQGAPEIPVEDRHDLPYSVQSDIFDLGVIIKCMVYGNVPLTSHVEWPVPAPLDKVVEACVRPDPGDRASLDEIKEMVAGIVEV